VKLIAGGESISDRDRRKEGVLLIQTKKGQQFEKREGFILPIRFSARLEEKNSAMEKRGKEETPKKGGTAISKRSRKPGAEGSNDSSLKGIIRGVHSVLQREGAFFKTKWGMSGRKEERAVVPYTKGVTLLRKGWPLLKGRERK